MDQENKEIISEMIVAINVIVPVQKKVGILG